MEETPSEANSSIRSHTSGTSQGTCGGPLRDCQTTSQESLLLGSTLSAINRAASWISST